MVRERDLPCPRLKKTAFDHSLECRHNIDDDDDDDDDDNGFDDDDDDGGDGGDDGYDYADDDDDLCICSKVQRMSLKPQVKFWGQLAACQNINQPNISQITACPIDHVSILRRTDCLINHLTRRGEGISDRHFPFMSNFNAIWPLLPLTLPLIGL